MLLTLLAPTLRNGQTHSYNLSAIAGELFECVWPFCGVGAYRVKFSLIQHPDLLYGQIYINKSQQYRHSKSSLWLYCCLWTGICRQIIVLLVGFELIFAGRCFFFCGTTKGFIKVFTVLAKPFKAPWRILN